ncbi:MAG: methyltransferase domain-containing protein [Planctomyces sp.]|nr:methyltransferase domain-containing protein [Planctomyces sp.]
MVATIQRNLILGQSVIRLRIPADPEQVLQEAVEGTEAGNRYVDPYWGLLWDAAPRTAERILRHPWQNGLRSLELGCGVGLTGIAGLIAGLDVTFTDLVPAAVEMAISNARDNGFQNAQGHVLDWCSPTNTTFPFIFASDVLYDLQNHDPLLNVLSRMLTPDGMVWIGDAGRANAPIFLEKAKAIGWMIELSDIDGRILSQPSHVSFQLITMTRPNGA